MDEAATRLALQERNPIHAPNTGPPGEIAAEYLRRIPAGRRGINLGCGGMTFKDWLNIDESQPHHCDIMCDLTKGLPFLPEGQFDAVYSEHFLEHIPRNAAVDLLRDGYRALRSGGHVRIAVPGLEGWIGSYLSGAKDPVDASGHTRAACGDVFGTRCELFNLAIRGFGHTYMYDLEELGKVFTTVGFVDVRACGVGVSSIPLLDNRECRPAHESSLIAEARKP